MIEQIKKVLLTNERIEVAKNKNGKCLVTILSKTEKGLDTYTSVDKDFYKEK